MIGGLPCGVGTARAGVTARPAGDGERSDTLVGHRAGAGESAVVQLEQMRLDGGQRVGRLVRAEHGSGLEHVADRRAAGGTMQHPAHGERVTDAGSSTRPDDAQIRTVQAECDPRRGGVRRFRAAIHAGLSEVPCTVREADDDRALLLNALENLHREQLSNLERVHTIERLGSSGLGVREISRRTGFNPSTISRWLRINRRPELKRALEENRLDVARAVILVDAPESVVNSLIEGAMAISTAELRQQVGAIKSGAREIVQKDRRHMSDALRYLRSVRSNANEPLLLEMLQMEIDRISGTAAIAAAKSSLNGTGAHTSSVERDNPRKLLTQVPSG